MKQPGEFVELAQTISTEALALHGKYFAATGAAELDYLTIFTSSPDEYEAHCQAARQLGLAVHNKNGPVYRLTNRLADDLPTRLVRVRDPNESPFVGCADFVVADYPALQEHIKTIDVACTDSPKTTGGVNYRMVELAQPLEAPVAIYLPSVRMTEKVMGLHRS